MLKCPLLSLILLASSLSHAGTQELVTCTAAGLTVTVTDVSNQDPGSVNDVVTNITVNGTNYLNHRSVGQLDPNSFSVSGFLWENRKRTDKGVMLSVEGSHGALSYNGVVKSVSCKPPEGSGETMKLCGLYVPLDNVNDGVEMGDSAQSYFRDGATEVRICRAGKQPDLNNEEMIAVVARTSTGLQAMRFSK